MANAQKYVDNVLGSDSNSGNAPGAGNAYLTLAFALTQISGGGNTVYIRATGAPYASASTVTFTAALKGDVTDGRNVFEGYTTTPGARDGRPVFSCSGSGVHIFTLNDNDNTDFVHLSFTHTHATTKGAAFTTVTSATTQWAIKDCVIDACVGVLAANLAGQVLSVEGTEVKNCTGTTALFPGSNGGALSIYGCDLHDNPCDVTRGGSFGVGYTVAITDSIVSNMTGVINGSASGATPQNYTVRNNIFSDITNTCIRLSSTTSAITLECAGNIMYGCTYGVENQDTQNKVTTALRLWRGNAYGATTSGAYLALPAGFGDITLTADPFTNRAARDYSLNSVAGGGALLRGKGFPATFPSGITNNRDVGALQHQDSGGGTVGGPPRVLQPNTWSLVG